MSKKEDKIFWSCSRLPFTANCNESASDFFSLLSKKISHHSGDERETAFLSQRVSVLVQRFNDVLLHDSFVFEDCPE